MKNTALRPASFFLPCLALCAGLYGGSALAAPVTFTASGTIGYGYDTVGEFGAANSSLEGKSAAITLSFDFGSPYFWDHGVDGYNSSGTVTQTVTVDGVTRSYELSSGSGWSSAGLSNYLSAYGQSHYDYYGNNYSYWYYDQIYAYSDGNLTSGDYISSNLGVYSYENAFNPGNDFTASFDYSPLAGDYSYGSFSKYSNSLVYDSYWGYGYNSYTQQAYFNLNVDRVAMNGAVSRSAAADSQVPEPSSAMLAGIALFGAAAVRRSVRRRTATATA